MPWQTDDAGAYCPTLEQIEEACARIQATWTATDRAKRRGMTLDMLERLALKAPRYAVSPTPDGPRFTEVRQ